MSTTYDVLLWQTEASQLNQQQAFLEDVRNGFSQKPYRLPSRWFYDEKGSELFKKITELPEYYLTRSEREILETHRRELADFIGDQPFNLIELGAGDGSKTRLLLDQFKDRTDFMYIPIDISQTAVKKLLSRVEKDYPNLNGHGLIAEYRDGLSWVESRWTRRNVVLFLGSSIGNFEAQESSEFLRNLRSSLNPEDYVLIGFDLIKSESILIPAYGDSRGVTAEFNLNLLARINRQLGGEFDLSTFRHEAVFNSGQGAMESYLVSRQNQNVPIASLERAVSFEKDDAIHTESSFKYTLGQIDELARQSGFNIKLNLM
ncbi:MAG: L-histidine N(alpha)-methyltransferase, partial [candidate division Zixibacteria bacterium]|nr:L-histidine N(alpha)-methyltransferase [candidate division Zixibacteria bacterium]